MTYFVAESIGVFGTITNLSATFLLARHNKHGWWMRLVTNVIWIVYAGTTASFSFSVALNHVSFFFMNIYGWYEWSRKRSSDAAGSSS